MQRRFRRAKGRKKSNNLAEKEAWFRDLVWHHYEMYKGCQLNNAADALKVDGDLPKDEVFSKCLGFCMENLRQVDLKPAPPKVPPPNFIQPKVILLPKRLQASEEPRKANLVPNIPKAMPRRPDKPPLPKAMPKRPENPPQPKAMLKRPEKSPQPKATLKRPEKPLVPKAMPKRTEKPVLPKAMPRKHENPVMPKAMPKKRPLRALEEEIANTPLPRPLPKKRPRPRGEYGD